MIKEVSKVKLAMTPEKLCIDESVVLLPYCREVFSIAFKEEPNYSKLKYLLISVLLNKNIVPNLRFDWSKIQERSPHELA
jgi:hypothetical protein